MTVSGAFAFDCGMAHRKCVIFRAPWPKVERIKQMSRIITIVIENNGTAPKGSTRR